MKKRRKALLSLFLALTMVISPLSATDVFAAEDEILLGTENPAGQSDTTAVSDLTQEMSTQYEEIQEEKPEEKTEEATEKKQESTTEKEDVTTEVVSQDEVTTNTDKETAQKDTQKDAQESSLEVVETEIEEKTDADENDKWDSLEETTVMKASADAVMLANDDAGSAEANTANIRVLNSDGSEYKMFVITESSAVLQGDKIAITISTNNVSYSKLYFGSPDDTVKEPVWSGTEKENGGWTFSFTIDAAKGGTNVPVVLCLKSGSWSTKALTMTIPDMGYTAPEVTPTPTVTPTPEPEEPESEVLAMYGDLSKEFSMFKIAKSTVKAEGNELAVEIYVKAAASGNFTYSKIYLGTKEDFGNGVEAAVVSGETVADNGENLQKYAFSLPLSAQGQNQAFVPVKENGTGYTSKDLVLTIPDLGAEPTPEPTPTPEEPTPVENEILAMYGDLSKEFSMFKIAKSTVKAEGDGLAVEIYVKAAASGNFTYSKIYLGTKEDFGNGVEAAVVSGETVADNGENLQKYAFSLPLSAQGQNQAFVPVKENGTGYTSKDLVLTIPDLGAEPMPEPTPTPEEPTPTPEEPTPTPEPGEESDINYMTGGSNLTNVKGITILSSTAALSSDGTKVHCTITLSGTEYDRLYFGDRADSVKEPVIYGVSDGTNVTFSYSVSAEKQGMYILFVPGKSSGVWYTTQDLFISVPNFNRTFDLDSYTDGIYNIYGNATTYNHIDQPGANPVDKGSTLIITGDTITLSLITRSNIDKIYIGNVADDDTVKDTNAVYSTKVDESDPNSYRKLEITLPKTAIGSSVPYVMHTPSAGWSTKQYRLEIGKYIEYIGEVEEPTPTPTPEEPTPTPEEPTPTPEAPVENGIYNVPKVETGESMFRIVNCQLTIKNGKMTAEIALSGTGYDYLYMGTPEEAFGADSSAWIPYTEKEVLNNENGNVESKYVYKIPVSALDTPLTLSARSKRYVEQGKGKDAWISRTITISSAGMTKIADLPKDDQEEPPVNPTPTVKPENPSDTPDTNGETTIPSGNDGKAEQESKYESDLSGSTSSVNSSTSLADGVYTPDKFSWSGGTGKVKISCNKVTVKNGQAYATIVFSSSSYAYVKANGRKYYGTISGNSSSFTIPVALNQNNTIIGMTTKMSADHEIQYSIYVYLAAAAKADGSGNGTDSDVVIGMGESNNQKLDDKAPQILGLTYDSETKVEYAEYFRIYHYEDGITLLEIDMTSDTARDPEKEKEDSEKDKEAAGEAAESEKEETAKETVVDEEETGEETVVNDEETGEEVTVTDEELIAELYMGNVVKYLIVPEGVEVPVGLEKEVIIVDLPVDKTYVASKEALSAMDELELLETIQALGFDKDECPIKELAEKMEEEELVFAGAFDDVNYKALVRAQCNLSIMPSELLPQEEDEDSAPEKTDENASDKNENDAEEEEVLTVEEQTERLEELAERHAMLWIPMMVDRSADEKTELAQYEWIKVYGALFGCEEEAADLFEKAVKAAK